MTTRLRPIHLISEHLSSAEAMQRETAEAPRTDPLVAMMLDMNDRDVVELRDELAAALTSDIELSLEGHPVTDHRIVASYFARVTNDLQSTYRAIAESVAALDKPTRSATALSIVGTSSGSFRVQFHTAGEELSLLDAPLAERTLDVLFSVIASAASGGADHLNQWAATVSEASVRSTIRLASTLASSHGTSHLRRSYPGGVDQVVVLSHEQAKELARGLAGASGRELLTVRGHLAMAQDRPPKVRISTAIEDFVAEINDDELLDAVRGSLFGEVVADISVTMSTSETSGRPLTRAELLGLSPASADEE